LRLWAHNLLDYDQGIDITFHLVYYHLNIEETCRLLTSRGLPSLIVKRVD
jgi:hypothetical protein